MDEFSEPKVYINGVKMFFYIILCLIAGVVGMAAICVAIISAGLLFFSPSPLGVIVLLSSLVIIAVCYWVGTMDRRV